MHGPWAVVVPVTASRNRSFLRHPDACSLRPGIMYQKPCTKTTSHNDCFDVSETFSAGVVLIGPRGLKRFGIFRKGAVIELVSEIVQPCRVEEPSDRIKVSEPRYARCIPQSSVETPTALMRLARARVDPSSLAPMTLA